MIDGYHAFTGTTDCGECISDEWFIVDLLLKISREFPRALITVEDDDGQFLLIEAAHQLPRWVHPDNIDNRVFISNGKLHLISPQLLETTPSIRDAFRLISSKTVASPAIQHAITTQATSHDTNIHYTHLIVPQTIARLLLHNPQFISFAIDAFLNRDSTHATTLASMRKYPPTEFSVITTEIPKPLFAIMKQSKFHPPRVFLQDRQCTRIYHNPSRLPREHSWLDIGMKVACGFEILGNSLRFELAEGQMGRYLDRPFPVVFPDSLEEAVMESKRELETSEKFVEVLERHNKEYEGKHPVDNEDWMVVDAEDMDRLLEERIGKVNVKSGAGLSGVGDGLKQFMKQRSGVDGIGEEDEDEDGQWENESETESEGTDDSDDFDESAMLDEEMVELMKAMDRELFGTNARDGNSKGEDFEVLKNILESFSSQGGQSGPAQTLLNSIGVSIPRQDEFHDDQSDPESDVEAFDNEDLEGR